PGRQRDRRRSAAIAGRRRPQRVMGRSADDVDTDDSQARRLVERLPGPLAGERLDRIVALVADVSRREATELIRRGGVTVNGGPADKPSQRPDLDDEVAIELPDAPGGPEADPAVEFHVVHEDEDVVVVDKPPHLVVHPGSGVAGATLVNGLLARYPDLAEVGQPDRPGIVHRLDRGTSGLLMVARTDRAYEDLVAQLAARTVIRRYRTLVEGVVGADEGLIDAPLGRSPRHATRRAVVADGRPARTRYEVLERYPDADRTSLACRLETGRTHQIRAHLEAIGHPVVADVAYGATTDARIGRPFLHAETLGFRHPGTGRTIELSSPLPDDLRSLLDELDRSDTGHQPGGAGPDMGTDPEAEPGSDSCSGAAPETASD
ncbi:MAG: RluA family pseudouridine synthase, partial [Actinomycetota bacterium]